MLIAFTSLPGFVTLVFRGMPTVWRGRHRLIFCWLIFMKPSLPGARPWKNSPGGRQPPLPLGALAACSKPPIGMYISS